MLWDISLSWVAQWGTFFQQGPFREHLREGEKSLVPGPLWQTSCHTNDTPRESVLTQKEMPPPPAEREQLNRLCGKHARRAIKVRDYSLVLLGAERKSEERREGRKDCPK